MFDYDFMRTAFAASGVVAVLSGVVGFFLVMRGQTFAGHALSHVGFTGATGAVLVGVSPLWGLIGFTVLSGFAMGVLGEKLSGRDVAIGMMLSLALGLGLLFLHFYTAYASQATALLFGNVLGVSNEALATLTGLAAVSSGGTRRNCPAAYIREPSAGASRGQGSACSYGCDGVPDDCRYRRRRMRADCWRAPRFHFDGRTVGGSATIYPAGWSRCRSRRSTCADRGLGWSDACLLHRLANEFLDHSLIMLRLFFQLVELVAGHFGAPPTRSREQSV